MWRVRDCGGGQQRGTAGREGFVETAPFAEAVGEAAEDVLSHPADGRRRSLELLLRVAPGSPQYRAACMHAIALAAQAETFGIVLEQFLSCFVRTGPLSAVELDGFYRLALLYERQGMLGQAEEALGQLLATRADHADAAAALARVEQARRARQEQRASAIMADEAVFLAGSRPAQDRPPGLLELGALASGAPAAVSATPGLPFAEGVLIGLRYRIGKLIGRGGMSLVFEARDLELARHVALKVFVHPVPDEGLLTRFKREMQVSRELQHANILKLHDLGTCQGYRFVSMERLVGVDLRQRMSEGLALASALDLLIQACDGLQAAHERGVIHRDIKPENLFVTDEGLLKIMDFGIAKVMSAPHVTLGGVLWGTPRYMSPEQIANFSQVTAASDLYSLGVVGYELVVGHPPFDSADLTEVLLMHLRQPPQPPRALKPGMPLALDALLLALLAKRVEGRPASAQACAERLRAIRRDLATN
jgi:tRNA A-37 threonylcarbamoyl transferase component Bud32